MFDEESKISLCFEIGQRQQQCWRKLKAQSLANSDVQLDWTPSRRTQKPTYRRTRIVTTIPRPPLESSRRGESKPALTIFEKFIFDLLFFETSENRVPTKIVKADLDSPR